MDFSCALNALKEGLKVRREGWNKTEKWLELSSPDDPLKVIYIREVCDPLLSQWLISQSDILASDWRIKYER